MTSYFDEHDCDPLGDNERPNEFIHLARLLIDSGIGSTLNMDFDSIANNGRSSLAPPVSKSWLVNELPKFLVRESEMPQHKCPICLIKFDAESSEASLAVRLPKCAHTFHKLCLLKWLEKTNSCPMCRCEFPTDDAQYEEFKRQRERKKVREQELADLHNSMFS